MGRKERRQIKKLARQNRGNGETPSGDFISTLLAEAVTYLQAGLPQDAFKLCQQALNAQPDHADALNLCGVAAFQLGDVEHALRMLEAAISKKPDYVDAYNNLGNIFRAIGHFDEAEAAYRHAIEIKPDYFDAHYNLGIVLEASDKLNEAENAYRQASEINSEFPEVLLNLGNVLKAMGKLDEAITTYERTLQAHPENPAAYNNIGSAFYELGRFNEAESAFRKALEAQPDHVDANYNLGIVLQELGKLDEAVAAYENVLKASPEYVKANVNLGYALHKLGKHQEAVATYRRAIELEPENAQVHANLGDILLEQGNARAAVDVCDDYLKRCPGNTGVLAFKAVALAELGERDGARALLDFDRFIRPTQLKAPAGFASLADFNAALAHHVRTHPTLITAPASHATRLGKHSGELLGPTAGPVAILADAIREAVEAYRKTLPADVNHPFLTSPPNQFSLTAWAVVLEAQGHQISHIHPSAWLSGVYYVKVPGVVSTADQQPAGWIEFGQPPEHFHCKVEPETRLLQPREGLMLLFPSYFYHRTIPFETTGQRISIAFDVRPPSP
ncbi:MAG: tetratricopeptide repeat protein [Acidiferrobacterales bacterium]